MSTRKSLPRGRRAAPTSGNDIRRESKAGHGERKGREFGFESRRAANGLVGILEYGTGDEVVGALIHLDVVPPGDLGEWEKPPFSGEVSGGTVFGRGAQDDKSALVGVLWGAKILIENGMTFPRRLRIVLGPKEETSFEDVRTYFAEEAPPDFGIVPDGPFLVRAESGYADLAYAFADLSPGAGEQRDTAVHWQGGTVVNSVRRSTPTTIRTTIRCSGSPSTAATRCVVPIR